MEHVRWGIISTGRIARVFAEHLPTSRTGRLVAVASRDVSRVSGFGDVRAHGSYEALLADDDVDAVYIATPHPMHARWAIAAAEAGKHVLCEKPLAMNLAEAEAVVETARRTGVFLMEAFMYRCHPQTQRLVDLVREGAIGRVRKVEAVHAFRAPDVPDSRLLANELGGGGILDVGCYCVSGARLVAGVALGIDGRAEPLELAATGHIGVTGVDDWAKATLRFDGGIVAELSTAVRVDEPPRLEITGTEGSVLLNEPWLPDARGKPDIVVRRKGRLRKEVIGVRGDRGLYAYQADVLADALAAGRTQASFPACTWADSLANARTLDRWRAAVGVSHPPDLLPAPVHGRELRRVEMPSVDVERVRLPVSRIALGTMVARDLTTTACQLGIFDAYFEAGGNTFDTAFIYADGESELALGRWMTTRGVRDEVVVIAKGAHTPDNFPDRIRPQLERSLERMATDRADLYFLHRDNMELPAGEFVDALDELRRDGLIDAYGGSNWTSERIDEANEWAREHGAAGFTSVSNQFSLARMHVPTYAGTLGANTPAFREWLTSRAMTNFAWSSQASGFFAGLQPDGFLAHAWFSDDNLERRRRTEELAAKLGVEPVTVALAWVLRCGLEIVPIAGPRSLAELRTSLDALDVTLSDEQVRWLDLENP